MVSEKFNITVTSIILVLLGILAMAFPFISTFTIGVITAFMLLFVAIMFFTTATEQFKFNKWGASINIILGMISIILSALLIFNPISVVIIASVIIYLLGLILLISGIMNLITANGFKPKKGMGINDIIFGLLYIIIGLYVQNPIYLGMIIGLWLIISGFFYGFEKISEDEIKK